MSSAMDTDCSVGRLVSAGGRVAGIESRPSAADEAPVERVNALEQRAPQRPPLRRAQALHHALLEPGNFGLACLEEPASLRRHLGLKDAAVVGMSRAGARARAARARAAPRSWTAATRASGGRAGRWTGRCGRSARSASCTGSPTEPWARRATSLMARARPDRHGRRGTAAWAPSAAAMSSAGARGRRSPTRSSTKSNVVASSPSSSG